MEIFRIVGVNFGEKHSGGKKYIVFCTLVVLIMRAGLVIMRAGLVIMRAGLVMSSVYHILTR